MSTIILPQKQRSPVEQLLTGVLQGRMQQSRNQQLKQVLDSLPPDADSQQRLQAILTSPLDPQSKQQALNFLIQGQNANLNQQRINLGQSNVDLNRQRLENESTQIQQQQQKSRAQADFLQSLPKRGSSGEITPEQVFQGAMNAGFNVTQSSTISKQYSPKEDKVSERFKFDSGTIDTRFKQKKDALLGQVIKTNRLTGLTEIDFGGVKGQKIKKQLKQVTSKWFKDRIALRTRFNVPLTEDLKRFQREGLSDDVLEGELGTEENSDEDVLNKLFGE